MFCRRCGAQVVDGAAHCPKCGARLSRAARVGTMGVSRPAQPGRGCELLGMLALLGAFVLFVRQTVTGATEVALRVFVFYEAPSAALAAAIFGTCGLVLCLLPVLGAYALAGDLLSGGPRSRGAFVRGGVVAGLLVVCCLALLAGAAFVGTLPGSEQVKAIHQALLAYWDAALVGLVPLVAAIVALFLGSGRVKNLR